MHMEELTTIQCNEIKRNVTYQVQCNVIDRKVVHMHLNEKLFSYRGNKTAFTKHIPLHYK